MKNPIKWIIENFQYKKKYEEISTEARELRENYARLDGLYDQMKGQRDDCMDLFKDCKANYDETSELLKDSLEQTSRAYALARDYKNLVDHIQGVTDDESQIPYPC